MHDLFLIALGGAVSAFTLKRERAPRAAFVGTLFFVLVCSVFLLVGRKIIENTAPVDDGCAVNITAPNTQKNGHYFTLRQSI